MTTSTGNCQNCGVAQFDNPNADPALASMAHLCWKCVQPHGITTASQKPYRYQPHLLNTWATRVTVAGRTFDFHGQLSDAAAIRQAEEQIGREAGHAAFHAGRGNHPLTDPALAAIVQGAKVGDKLHALEAFNRAWTRTNLAQPIPREDVQAAPAVLDDAGLVYTDTLF